MPDRQCKLSGCDRKVAAGGMCYQHYRDDLYSRNPQSKEMRTASKKAWDKKNNPNKKYADRLNAWRKKNHHKMHSYHAKQLYGLPLVQYFAILRKQGQMCAICDKPFGRVPHVDHDHITKQVRGFLCRSCNLMLGNCKDDTTILKSAIKYLEVSRCRSINVAV